MNDTTCQTCGKPLPEDAPQGICPACLLQRTLQDGGTAAPQPPELEMQQLAAAFPQLVIEEMIGQGGMGRVYRAQQPHLNRTVALKVLSAERVADPEWLERFSREARALARLSHPHIVQVYDFGEKPLPYLLMEHVDGVNLRQAMQDGGLTAREALTIVPKLCDALHYAHEHGVLHRDIKPENILIDTEGRVKLVDFGLAKLRDEGVLPFTLTQSGTKLGTMAYMAPEQVEKPAEVDHRADIYSLGVVFYEMLTGELPLGRFPTPSEASGVDPRLDDVVMRTLEKKKEKRFQDAGAMRTGIEKAQTEPLAPDTMSREMFVTIVFMALWPVAIGILGSRLPWGGMVVVVLSATVLLACGILRLRQQIMRQPVRPYYPARITALVASAAAFLMGSFWGPGLMALLVAALWMKITWKKDRVHRPEGGVMRCMRALWNALGALISFVMIVTLTAMVHEWLNATLKTPWLTSVSIAVTTLGLLLALYSSIPELRGAWHLMRGITPSPHRKSSVQLGILAMVAVLLAPTFSRWMPVIRFDNRAAWQVLAGVPAPQPAPTKQKTTGSARQKHLEALGATYRRKQEENKPMHAKSQAWIARATKADSQTEQEAVLKEILAALQSRDAATIRAGLTAVRGLHQLEFDRAPFRELARLHLKSDNVDVRAIALYALMTCQPDDSDQQRVLALVPNAAEDELPALASAMRTVSKNDFTGEFAAPMLAVLERGMAAAQRDRVSNLGFDGRSVLGVIWGSRASPQIEKRLIEWSHVGEDANGILSINELGYDTFYHALSVQSNKSREAVKRILELAHQPDTVNIAGRCLWGLNGTVPDKADQAYAASGVIKLLGMRTDNYLWKQGLTVLAAYAGKEHLTTVEAMAARETLPKARKEGLNKIIEKLRAMP